MVQECRALGKPIVLSDLDVHEEYCYGSTFRQRDPQDLAVKMDSLLSSCQPGPDIAAESQAKTGALAAVEARGREFCNIVLEHLGCPESQVPRPRPEPPVTIVTSLAPDNILSQQAAVRSWQQCGFKTVALNAPDDIDALKAPFSRISNLSLLTGTAGALTANLTSIFRICWITAPGSQPRSAAS